MRCASIALVVASLALLFGSQRTKAESPVPHPAQLASDDPWANERYQLGGNNNSRQANQFGATVGSGAPAATQATSPLDRAQSAVVGTAGTLRDGIESGIKQANQQFQSATGLGSQSQTPSATTWPAPPPLSSAAGVAPTSAAPSSLATTRPSNTSGWTSIHTEMAPPTLLTPPLLPLSNSATGSLSSTATTGPSFPSSAPPNNSAGSVFNSGSGQRDSSHSLLIDPNGASRQNGLGSAATTQSAAKSPDWSSGWGNTTPNQATIGRTSDTTLGSSNVNSSSTLPRVGPEVPRQPTGNFATEADPWNRSAPATPSNSSTARNGSPTTVLGDRYNQPGAQSQTGANIWADLPTQSTASSASAPQANFNNQPGGIGQPATSFSNFSNQPNLGQPSLNQPSLNQPSLSQPGLGQSTIGQNVAGQPVLGQQGNNMSTLGFGSQNGMPGQQPPNQDEHPWVPLLIASVTLAGSLGANLFLGWSYADARHRYHLVVRRSTESFHKATGIAA